MQQEKLRAAMRAARARVRRRHRVLHHLEHVFTMTVGGCVCFGFHVGEAVASGGMAILMIIICFGGYEEDV